MPPKAPEEKIRCPECEMLVQRRNLSRHRQVHLEAKGEAMSRAGRTFMCRGVTSVAPARSRSSSRDSQQSAVLYQPSATAAAITDVIDVTTFHAADSPSTSTLTDASRAILHQRNAFTEDQLCSFIARQYPGIPAACRRYLVVGAVSGAQYAACQHHLWRDNARVTDTGLRKMASEAASTLSWWTLGFRPDYSKVIDSVDYEADSRLHDQAEEPPAKVVLAIQGEPSFPIDDLQLPVSLPMSNQEFERALSDIDLMIGEEIAEAHAIQSTDVQDTAVHTETAPATISTAPSIETTASDTMTSSLATCVATSGATHPDTIDAASVDAASVSTSATIAYSPGERGDIVYQPTPIVVLERAEALRQKCLKKKAPGEEPTMKIVETSGSARDGGSPPKQAVRNEEAMELHAPSEIDTIPEAGKKAQPCKPEHKNLSKPSTQETTPSVKRRASDMGNEQGKKPDKPKTTTSRDQRPQGSGDRRERSPVRRREDSPVNRREKSPADSRVGLYRLSAEEYAIIEKKRRERSNTEYRPTYRRK